jgi:hypothetical protein
MFVAVALLLGLAASAGAQQAFTGTVARIDSGAGVIVFDDGRMLQTTADSVVISGNRRMTLAMLQPGTSVTVYGAQPVALREGRYVVMGDRSASTPTAPAVSAAPAPAGPPRIAIVPPPAPPVVATAPAPGPTSTELSSAPTVETSGTVLGTDPNAGVIALTDGRHVRVNADTQLFVNNVPVHLGALQPGTHVVIRTPRPFANRWSGPSGSMQPLASGAVVRVDRGSAIVLSDGRVIPMTPDTVVTVDNRPVAVAALQPGSHVVIYRNPQPAGVDAPAASPLVIYPEWGTGAPDVDDAESQAP